MVRSFILLIVFTLVMTPGFVRAETGSAIFAAGCFWCIEKDMEDVPGVLEAVSGYTGGAAENPSYKPVSKGSTGHYEAVLVTYDPAVVNYKELLKVFWRNVDPHNAKGQFCDKGSSYRAAIFYGSEKEMMLAMESRDRLENSGALSGEIVTEILPAGPFWKAEAYHQNYYRENPLRYKYYRHRCGRDKRLEAVWGDANLDKILK